MCVGSSRGQSFGPIPVDPPSEGADTPGACRSFPECGRGTPCFSSSPQNSLGFLSQQLPGLVPLPFSLHRRVRGGPGQLRSHESRAGGDGTTSAAPSSRGPHPGGLRHLPTPILLNLPPDSIWLSLSVPKQRPRPGQRKANPTSPFAPDLSIKCG